MNDTKQEIPVFGEKKIKPNVKPKLSKVEKPIIDKSEISAIHGGSTDFLKKIYIIQAMLVLSVTGVIWLFLQNSDLTNIISRQNSIIQKQEKKINELVSSEKKLESELKAIRVNITDMKNRQDKVESYAKKAISGVKGETVVETNLRQSKEMKVAKGTLEKVVKENEKLLSINSEISENNKKLQAQHKKILDKYMDLIKTFDPECKSGKCLNFSETKVPDAVTKEGELRESTLELYKAKALLKSLGSSDDAPIQKTKKKSGSDGNMVKKDSLKSDMNFGSKNKRKIVQENVKTDPNESW